MVLDTAPATSTASLVVGPLSLAAATDAMASALFLGPFSYTPDDGTQGYTPYFYKMDVPVRVTNTISYGRAWQLLRSRGAGSNATGPCDPPQLANSCNCSSSVGLPLPFNIGVKDDHDSAAMPNCIASPLCNAEAPAAATPATNTAILLVLDAQRQNMRFPIGNCVPCLRRGYGRMVRELIRVLISLRNVKTTVPIHILASGERYPRVEARLAALFPGIKYISGEVPPVVVPSWASKWARGSFAKLRALALTQFTKLLVLDSDSILLRNVDHLLSSSSGSGPAIPTPAFVFAWKCYPRRELRASTMLLTPNLQEYDHAQKLASSEATAIYDDLGEQSVWRRLYKEKAYELPAGYAAMRTADLPTSEWGKVHIVHDAHLIHDVQRAGWHGAGMTAIVDAVDKEATKLFKAEFNADFADPPKKKPGGGRGGRGKRGRRGRE